MKPQEPPSKLPTTTSTQPKENEVKDTTAKVDTLVSTLARETVKEKTRQKDTFVSTAQTQGALSKITIIDQGRKE